LFRTGWGLKKTLFLCLSEGFSLEEEDMDWMPIDYNPQDRLDPSKCIAGHNAIADVRETVHRTCPVMGSVEPACTMYREENGQWYRSKEPVTWGEMRIFTEGQ
jgi:hypothetical protein